MRTLSVYPGAGTLASPVATAAPPPMTTVVAAPIVDVPQAQAAMTTSPDPGILNLSQNNDLDIATLARQAKRNDQSDNEVVVSLR